MKDYRLQFKRRFEILGMVLSNNYKYKIEYFEDLYEVNNLTIKRDLRSLRNLGIAIHSIKGKGIGIFSDINDELLKDLVMHYTGMTVNKNSYDKATNLLVKKLHRKSVSFITVLQRSIENNFCIKIEYKKSEEKKSEVRVIQPYCIFQSDKNWRLLANHEGRTKQFLINKIISLNQLDKKFKQVPRKYIDEIFSTSFKSWLGNERYKVRLKFLPPWPEWVKPRQLMEFQKIIENPDGSIEYETIVNSLKEIAIWIVSRGEGVVVLEPEELKNKVIKIAEGVLKNYKQ